MNIKDVFVLSPIMRTFDEFRFYDGNQINPITFIRFTFNDRNRILREKYQNETFREFNNKLYNLRFPLNLYFCHLQL